MKQRKSKRKISAEEETMIYASYCKGEKRTFIMKKYKISYMQFTQIIRSRISTENEKSLAVTSKN